MLNDAEKKVRLKRLIKRRQEAEEVVKEKPALAPVNLTNTKD